jgi:hypothetical protein
MVDLYDLKLLPNTAKDNNNTNYWSPNIDERVAHFDFGNSMMEDAGNMSALFSASAIGADPRLVSTDSLDIEMIRMRCENNQQNDYKLTFEDDSGQWTTSGIGASFITNASASPTALHTRKALRFLRGKVGEQPKNEIKDDKYLLQAHNLGNHDHPSLRLLERLNSSQKTSNCNVETEEINNLYSELYLGNGRYIDMNHNEIGFDPSYDIEQFGQQDLKQTSALSANRYIIKNDKCVRNIQGKGSTTIETNVLNDRQSASLAIASSTNNISTSRTFADLSPSKTAPDLQFIALSYKVPSICTNSSTVTATASFDDILKQAKDGNLGAVLECCPSEKLLFENDIEFENPAPDSGLGSSHSEGPSHIEDWHSLSVLLPRHVVDACSFFKTNSFLLSNNDNNIDRRRCYCCACSRNKLKKLFNQKISQVSRSTCNNFCCYENDFTVKSSTALFNNKQHRNNCLASTVSYDRLFSSYPFGNSSASHANFTRLHQRELAIIGLPIYEQKRGIVERVVSGVGDQMRGASTSVVLLSALESLLLDGLHSTFQPWDVVRRLTGKGPVTASIFQLCEELEVSEKPRNSLISHFFQGLIALHAVDCWFSYIVLKEHQLSKFYTNNSFLLGANTSYRSLFSRFIDCLELLSVLNRCNRIGSLSSTKVKKRPLVGGSSFVVCEGSCINNASKLPSDSRVPKSSSLPLHSSNSVLVNKSNVNSIQTTKEEYVTRKLSDVSLSTRQRQRSKIPIFRLILNCFSYIF